MVCRSGVAGVAGVAVVAGVARTNTLENYKTHTGYSKRKHYTGYSVFQHSPALHRINYSYKKQKSAFSAIIIYFTIILPFLSGPSSEEEEEEEELGIGTVPAAALGGKTPYRPRAV